VIEQCLAAELGDLSDAAAGANASQLVELRQVLRVNAHLGRWADAVMAMPRSTRVGMFAWGMQHKILPVVNMAFSRWSANRIRAGRQLAALGGRHADAILAILLRDPVTMVHLTVMSLLWNHPPTAALRILLRRWADDPQTYAPATPRRWPMFLFGSKMVSAAPVLYRRDLQTDQAYAREFATTVLDHWKQQPRQGITAPTPVATTTRTNRRQLAAGPLKNRLTLSNAAAAQTAMQHARRALSRAITGWMNHHVSVRQIHAAMIREYTTLICVMAAMPWQHELKKIMDFNAAMSHWIDLVARLPPHTSRMIFNWARYRTQDVELMRMAMSRRRALRLRAVRIAPKLHGEQRAWLVHRLLADQSATVEFAMLHELWKLPASPRLIKTVQTWATLDPLPPGHNENKSTAITLNGHAYSVSRAVKVRRYEQARKIGAMVLRRWKSR
jgi:hypothetical protein